MPTDYFNSLPVGLCAFPLQFIFSLLLAQLSSDSINACPNILLPCPKPPHWIPISLRVDHILKTAPKTLPKKFPYCLSDPITCYLLPCSFRPRHVRLLAVSPTCQAYPSSGCCTCCFLSGILFHLDSHVTASFISSALCSYISPSKRHGP